MPRNASIAVLVAAGLVAACVILLRPDRTPPPAPAAGPVATPSRAEAPSGGAEVVSPEQDAQVLAAVAPGPAAALPAPAIEPPAAAAREHDHGHDHESGTTPTVRRAWSGDELQRWADSRKGDLVSFVLADGREAKATLEYLRVVDGEALYVSGRISQPEEGRFFFQKQTVKTRAGDFVGIVEFPGSGTAFRLEPVPGGGTELVARKLTEVKCVGLPPPPATNGPMAVIDLNPENAPPIQNPVYQGAVPTLESLPGAVGVLYLDFDGEYTPTWGGIDAAPAGMSSGSISDLWRRVSADYLPYTINVTTDRRVFDRAPEGSRQMCIITTTTDAAPGAGGVSYIGSWEWSGNTPNWVFITSGDSGAEAASHEVGHALGLGHDGQTNGVGYYAGHGSGELEWSPIMGVGYYTPLSQWSKGEYAMANNQQDDLAIIDGNNNVNYRTDEHGSNYVGASWLEIYPGSRVTNEGIIARNTDIDAFKFSTTGGVADLTVNTVMAEKQIAYNADLIGPTNAVLASFTSTTSLAVRVVTNLPAGDYALRIRGAGRNNPTNGFSSYASLGYYRLTGTVAGGEQPRRFYLSENPTNNQIVGTITNSSPADPHVWVITGGNTGTAFAVTTSNGVLRVASTNAINFEAREWIDLFVTISNTANPALDETGLRVVVHINNVNETPVFKAAGPFAVFEGTAPGVTLGTLSATDADDYTRLRYSIGGGNSNNTFAIEPDTGVLSVNNTVARPASTNFTLTIRAIDGIVAGAKTGTLQVVVNVLSNAAPTANGSAAYSYFANLGSGTSLTGLTGNARFPHGPDFVTLLSAAETQTDAADSYGGVIRAWLQVPFSGNYQFAIAGDDAAELRLSTSGVPAAATAIASTTAWTDSREWTKYASQKSAQFSLQAGQVYYLEARMKEATGGDNLAVGWSNVTMGGSTFAVISGAYLSPCFIDPVPPPWSNQDLGDVGSPGISSFYQGQFAVAGSGADIWSTGDQCQVVSMPFDGNGSFTALVVSQRATHAYAKSGVMFRESLDPGARFFDVVATPSNGVAVQYRSATSGTTVNAYSATNLVPPVWVRVVRSGNVFSGFYSTNGDAWVQAGTAPTIAMSTSAVAALAVTAHDNAITNLSRFTKIGLLPAGFDNDDIGNPAPPGGAWLDTGSDTWHVLGGGTDIGGGTDRFHFVHTPMPGDCTLTARIENIDNTDPSAKAGLMLRASTASNAAYGFVFATPTNLWFQYRTNTAASAATAGVSNRPPLSWVKLARNGNTLRAYCSGDGTNWTQFGSSPTVTLPPLALGGLAVTSRDSLTNNLARFSAFTATPSLRDFVWTNTPAGAWDFAAGWTNGIAPDLGGSRDYGIVVMVASNTTATNTLGSSTNAGFLLNSLSIVQNPVVLSGSNLVFRSGSDGAAPILANTTTGSTIGAAITLLDATTVTGNSGQTLTLNGAIGGTGLLVKSGNNTLILTSTNSHALTRVAQGTLQLAGAGTLGTGSAVTNNGTIVFARTGTYVIANAIHGTGGLSKGTDNNGAVVLAGTNTFTGGVTINNGGITLRHAQGLGTGTKTISMNNGSAGNSHLRLDGSGGDIDLDTNIAFFTSNGSGSIYNDAGSNTLRGNFTLSSGGGGTVFVSLTGRLTVAGALTPNTSGRTLNLRGGADGEISGPIRDDGSTNALAVLRDSGTGTWTLSGTNIYVGATTISSGRLLVDGFISTGAVSVGAAGTLGGRGVIGGAVTASGTIRPGDDAPGLLTVSNNVTLQSGARYAVRLAGYTAGAEFDRLVVGGNAVLNGALLVTVTNGFDGVITNGARFSILTAGGVSGSFTNATNGAEIATSLGALVVSNSSKGVTLTYRASRPALADWQLQYFGCTNCPQAAATNDADGDGMSNAQEWLAGTSPTNAASLFRVVSLGLTNNNLVVTWSTTSNRIYVVQSGALTNTPAALATISIPAGSSVTQTNIIESGSATNGAQFYWIKLLVP